MQGNNTQPTILSTPLSAEIIQQHYANISKLSSNDRTLSISSAFLNEHTLANKEINTLYEKLYYYLYRTHYLDYSDLPKGLTDTIDLKTFEKQLENPLLTTELTEKNKTILHDILYPNKEKNHEQEAKKLVEIFNELFTENAKQLTHIDTDIVKEIPKLSLGVQALLLTCFKEIYGDIFTLTNRCSKLNYPDCLKDHVQLSSWEQDLLIYLTYIRNYALEPEKKFPLFSISNVIKALACPQIGLNALPFIANKLEKSLQDKLDHSKTVKTQRKIYQNFMLLDHLLETKNKKKISSWFSKLTQNQIDYLNTWLLQVSKNNTNLPKNYKQLKASFSSEDIDFNDFLKIYSLREVILKFYLDHLECKINSVFFNHKDIKLYQKLLIATRDIYKNKSNIQLKLYYHREVISLIAENKFYKNNINQDIYRMNTQQRELLKDFFDSKNLTLNEQKFIYNITTRIPDTSRPRNNLKSPITNNKLLEIAKWLEKYADHPQIESSQYQDMLKIFLQAVKDNPKFKIVINLLFFSLLKKQSHCHINTFLNICPEYTNDFKETLLENWKDYFLHAIKTGDINLLKILEQIDPQQAQLAIWISFHSRKELIKGLSTGKSQHFNLLPADLHSIILILNSIFKDMNHTFYHNNGSEMKSYLLSNWDIISDLITSLDHPALAILYELDPEKFHEKYKDIIDPPKPIGIKTLIQLLDYDIPNCVVTATQSCDDSIYWVLNHLNNESDRYHATYFHSYSYSYTDPITRSTKEIATRLLEFRPADLLPQPAYKATKNLTIPEIKQFETYYYELQNFSRWLSKQALPYIQPEYIDYKKMLVGIDVLWETLNHYKYLDQQFITHIKVWLSNNNHYSLPNYQTTLNWFIMHNSQEDTESFIQRLFLNFILEGQMELAMVILNCSCESDLANLEISPKFRLILEERWEFLFDNALINENLTLLALLKRINLEKLSQALNTGATLKRAAKIYPKALEWLLAQCPNKNQAILEHELIKVASETGNGKTLFILGNMLDKTTLTVLLKQLNADKNLQTANIIANIWGHLNLEQRQMIIDHFNQKQRQQLRLSKNPNKEYSMLSIELENLAKIPLNPHNPSADELKSAIQVFHNACISYYKKNQLLEKDSQMYKIVKEMQQMLITLNNPDNGELSKQEALEKFIANSQLHISSGPYFIARSILQVAAWATIFIATTALITAASLLISTPISLAIVYMMAYESLYTQLIWGTLTIAGLITCSSKFGLPYTHEKTEFILQKMDNLESSAGPKQLLLQEKIDCICSWSQAFFKSPKMTVAIEDPRAVSEPQLVSTPAIEPEEHQAFWF